MKLIMENWRGYLKEQDEVDEALGDVVRRGVKAIRGGGAGAEEEESLAVARQAGEAGGGKAIEGIETFGQLKKLLRVIELRRKGGVAWEKVKGSAPEYIAGIFPGGGTAVKMFRDAKDGLDFLRDIYSADDGLKTQTGMDKLNVDDNVSKIIDDPIEVAFLKLLPNIIAEKGDDEPIGDFNITAALQAYLTKNFDGTTVKK
tara:strand:- start:912 stop:1514 length:603 start_codon:yes stop_codon:yes gene_type:complete